MEGYEYVSSRWLVVGGCTYTYVLLEMVDVRWRRRRRLLCVWIMNMQLHDVRSMPYCKLESDIFKTLYSDDLTIVSHVVLRSSSSRNPHRDYYWDLKNWYGIGPINSLLPIYYIAYMHICIYAYAYMYIQVSRRHYRCRGSTRSKKVSHNNDDSKNVVGIFLLYVGTVLVFQS